MSAPTQNEVDRVIAAYENAADATEYAGRIVMEMQQVRGTEYGMVWTSNPE